MRVGVLAVQGNFHKHAKALRRLGVETVEVRLPEELEGLDGLDGEPVLLRQGRILVAAFHPELTGDLRVHELFLAIVREEAGVRA